MRRLLPAVRFYQPAQWPPALPIAEEVRQTNTKKTRGSFWSFLFRGSVASHEVPGFREEWIQFQRPFQRRYALCNFLRM